MFYTFSHLKNRQKVKSKRSVECFSMFGKNVLILGGFYGTIKKIYH